jgi:hypothetical protein
LRALRRITIEMRKMIRAQQFNIDNPIDWISQNPDY